MRPQASDSLAAWPAEVTPPSGVLVLSGYGLDVRVWRGRLRVADGIGRDRREAIVHRATGRLRRLVVLGHTGSVSLEAIRWLADVGAGYLQVDADGRVLAAFGPQGSHRPGLRRAQAKALDTSTGLGIARRLIAEKVAAQADTLVVLDRVTAVGPDVVATIRASVDAVHEADRPDAIRLAEAIAASAYWSAWSPVPVAFARRDAERLPAHWRTFGARTSPLTGSPRLAANPPNAVLNYLYALLEAEATLAARIVGLDPGVGVLHADQPNRDSLAADLMEPVRPLVDRLVLRLLTERSFALTDFHETRQGVCRVTAPLARELAATTPNWAQAVGRVAEDVARWLDDRGPTAQPTPTPVSGRNRSAGRGQHSRGARPRRVTVRRGCVWCGGPTSRGRRTCSAGCERGAREANFEAFVSAGTDGLRRMHEAGRHPEIGEDGRQRLSRRTSELVAAARAWQRENPWPADMTYFTREVAPRLAGVPVRALVEATGLSITYGRRVRDGKVVPHPMWWERIERLCGPAEKRQQAGDRG